MASKDQYTVYWDSCVFLAYLNEEPGRVDTIQYMWEEVVFDNKGVIVTSALSIAEVAHAANEKANKRTSSASEEIIDKLWHDPNIIIVESPSVVMYEARKLMRMATDSGWSLRAYDAIHLATAKYIETSGRFIQEFNTYDQKLFKYQSLISIVIQEPHYRPKAIQTEFFPTT